MSHHIVSQNHTDITIEIVDDYLRQIPQRNQRHARDYLYEDRLIRTMHMPGRLVAELRGYHDSYIPYFELSHGSWQGGCTCERSGCSHLAALLTSFLDHPDTFVFPPFAIEKALESPWNLIAEERPIQKIVRLMPNPVPWWMKKHQQGQNKPTSTKTASLEDFLRQPAMLADLHPSWLEDSVIHQGILTWDSHKVVQRPGFPFWLNLWAYNPYLPLDSVFLAFSSNLEDHVPLILSLLWRGSLIPFSPDRAWHRVHRLLSLLEPLHSSPILWLWNQFSHLDPLYLSRTHALMVRDGPESAIQYIEQHWPADPKDQHRVRRALIQWLPEQKKLPYWIAECLDTGSRQDLQDLAALLDPTSYRNLEELFNHRWTSSAES